MATGPGERELIPAICRENAKTCRELAARNSDPRQRQALEEIAAAWDQLALDIARRTS
jgi:hypothetical protein